MGRKAYLAIVLKNEPHEQRESQSGRRVFGDPEDLKRLWKLMTWTRRGIRAFGSNSINPIDYRAGFVKLQSL